MPIPFDEFKVKMATVKTHFDNLKKFGSKSISDSVYYEIGAGYDMAIPISLSLLGFSKLICVDVRKLTFIDLLNDTLEKIKKLNDAEIRLSVEQKKIVFTKRNFSEALQKFFKIDYRAPLDARRTNMKEGSINYSITNAVLEHIPEDILYDIMKETYRVLDTGGIMSNIIDYRDHFAYFDSKINFYNYLTFTNAEWEKLNPSIMFQNRLRHRDYVKMAEDIGFEIVKNDTTSPDENLFEDLKKMKISTEFTQKYSFDEMKILGSQLVLRKP
ncbi:MAG: hypothetical protein J0M18_04720 [Ignavibacteria bacterium]|nr:hypothetical protein [Ignavibacteria bacterium]